jgi:drug/metabolite transporter (DMT)-like permease
VAAAAAGRGHALGITLVIVSACAFGSGALFAKPVYAAGMDWLGLLAWRFLFGAAVGWAWLLARRADRAALRRISRRRLLVLLALGILYVTNSGTYYAALETVPASLAAVIVYLYPAIVAVLALRWGRRLPGRRPWLALGIATFGVVLAVGGVSPDAMPPISGIALALASPIIYAGWIILSARLAGERPQVEDALPPEAMEAAEETEPAPASALMMTATWAVFFVLATATGRPTVPWAVPEAAWFGLIGIGVISTAIAIQTFYAGTRRVGAAQAALISTVEPIYTITLAVLLFGETLTAVQLLGGALVIVGVIIAQTAPRPVPLTAATAS